MVDENFLCKPKCISEWYSINVNYVHEGLTPTFRLSNDYSRKNLLYDDYQNLTASQEKQNIFIQIFK